MQKSDFISGGIFAVLAAAFMVGAIQYGIRSPTSDGVPGAGFFPFVLSLVVLLLAISLMVQSFTSKAEKIESAPMDAEQKSNLRIFFFTIGSLLLMFVVWHVYRFEAAAVIFCLVTNFIYRRNWKFNILYTIFVVGLIYFLFSKVLYISFDI